MSPRRVLAGSALALVLPASLLLGLPSHSATESAEGGAASASLRTTATQWVHLQALPQIVQQGARVASPDAAKAAITATIRPVEAGRKVRLEVERDSHWESVATVRQNAKGRAQFAAPATSSGRPLTYRVRAAAFEGLEAITSDTVSTARWLSPTWTDEFTGSALSPTWHHRGQHFDVKSLRRCSRGDPKAVEVGDGAVRLSVMKDRSQTTRCKVRVRDEFAGRYAHRLNGHIGTEGAFSFKYGIAAARMKFHRTRGQHGSFWMQAVGGMYPGGTGHEIDVIEYFGDNHRKGGLTTFIHRYEGSRVVKTGARITDIRSFLRNKRDGWSKNYHVFSVEWTPQTLIFRIDGKETTRISGGISSVPQFPILSLLSSDYEIPKMKGRQLPQHMYVDWIRVWETGS
ncbi:glycosyl hydrolase family protein [Nocardioides seonyuensis]|uniref:Glycosyl hydrolase family protein n=1 Tax=Nocardioides seonyuensis TaxID=2518371 RepID=A0A4P7IDR2_9ACTN|nr:glycoside hydrolase family 16 protein [Nocardioides seonyuensis]QBX55319.1 glycosyl hydrolase family protein [Nocardioides seonyuensis]